jgi:hypothetical protein
MEQLWQIISVFGVAFVSFWGAIPVGLALGLSPWLVAVTSIASYAAGVVVMLVVGQFAGPPVRAWLQRRMGTAATPAPDNPIMRVWQRFGVVGLGLAAPMITGALLGVVVGLALGAPPRRLALWLCVGALVWGVVLTALAALGVLGVQSVVGAP